MSSVSLSQAYADRLRKQKTNAWCNNTNVKEWQKPNLKGFNFKRQIYF